MNRLFIPSTLVTTALLCAMPLVCRAESPTTAGSTDGSTPAPTSAPSSSMPNLPAVNTGARPPVTMLSVGATHTFSSDLDGTSGDVSRTTILGSARYNVPMTDQLVLGAFASGGTAIYHFSGASGLAPGDVRPWQQIDLASIGVNGFFHVDEHWNTYAALHINSAFESDAQFDDSITEGGLIGASYTFSPDLTVGVGILAQSRLENYPQVFPVPTLEWKLPFDEQRRWTLEVGNVHAGPVEGGGIALTYAVDDKLMLTTGIVGLGVGGEFRLDKNGPTPGGVGRDSAFPLTFGVAWKPWQNVRLSGVVGVNLKDHLEVLDASGNKIFERDVDPTAVVGTGLTISF